MSKSEKRRHHETHHHHHSPEPTKKLRKSFPSRGSKRPIFTSYHEVPDLPPKIKLLCGIVANTSSASVEKVLDESGIRVTQETVEEVLKLSYAYPGPAVKFFRWSAYQLNNKQSPYAWNLLVDLLGKNSLFDAMWDAIKSMKKEGLLSLATFASVFSSYVVADNVRDAIRTFEVMEQYGCKQDIVALNSLLSAICRDGETISAFDFLRVVKGANSIRPDADTYAILLEGWENEGDVVNARKTFAEMVGDIGWDPGNVPAYNSFLCTLLKGSGEIYEAINSLETITNKMCYPGMKFFNIALELCLKNQDVRGAELIWNAMLGQMGFRPDTQMYNTMISLYCYSNNTDAAMKLLDEMVYNGAFPDTQTYNVLFKFLIKSRKIREASVLFNEMVKNEFVLSQENCHSAVRIYINTAEPYIAIKFWKYMVENYRSDLTETGNMLVVGLCDRDMHPEAVKYAEGLIEKGIILTTQSLCKLKQSLAKARKVHVYEELLRKRKA